MVKVYRFNKLNINKIKVSVPNTKLIKTVTNYNENNYFFVPIYLKNKDILIQTAKSLYHLE